jgi:hypothetical protein
MLPHNFPGHQLWDLQCGGQSNCCYESSGSQGTQPVAITYFGSLLADLCILAIRTSASQIKRTRQNYGVR